MVLASVLIVLMIAATMFSFVAGTLDRLGYSEYAITGGVIAALVAVAVAVGLLIRFQRKPRP